MTLTYSPQQLPIGQTLVVEHTQDFWRSLRRALKAPVRYFMCGEYGEQSFRPHYHAIVFGEDFSRDRVLVEQKGKARLFRSPFLDAVWERGMCTVGDVTFQSASYVARYVMKKATGQLAESRYSRVDPDTGEVWAVKPEFVTMSRRPGIGKGWFERWKSDVFPSDEVVFDGKRFRPPRYYDSLLSEAELDQVRVQRQRAVRERAEDLTPARLDAKSVEATSYLNGRRRGF